MRRADHARGVYGNRHLVYDRSSESDFEILEARQKWIFRALWRGKLVFFFFLYYSRAYS